MYFSTTDLGDGNFKGLITGGTASPPYTNLSPLTKKPQFYSMKILGDIAKGQVTDAVVDSDQVDILATLEAGEEDIYRVGISNRCQITSNIDITFPPGDFAVKIYQVEEGGITLVSEQSVRDFVTFTVPPWSLFYLECQVEPGGNTAPVAQPESVTTDEDTPKGILLKANDADGDSLTYYIVTPPSYGSLSGIPPNLIYTPNLNYNGTDYFTFQVSDGQVASNTAMVYITVDAVNDAPIAVAQSVVTVENSSTGIFLEASDVDGDDLTYNIVTSPTKGTLSGSAPHLTYTPNANYSGSDYFSFQANDGQAASNTATVSITIEPVNNPPVAIERWKTTNKNTPKTFTLTGSDPDNDPLTFSIVTQPTHGTLSGTLPQVTYTPDNDYAGKDTFEFKVNDGTVDSAPAIVHMNVLDTNSAPVAQSQSVSFDQDTPQEITLTATDADNDSLTYTITNYPTHGTLSGTVPGLIYTPDVGYSGSDYFSFQANDGQATSNTATVAITINSVASENNPPVAIGRWKRTSKNTSKTFTLTATDEDNDPLTFIIVSPPEHGTLSGTLPEVTYTPDYNYRGKDPFYFKVNDGTDDSNVAKVMMRVR